MTRGSIIETLQRYGYSSTAIGAALEALRVGFSVYEAADVLERAQAVENIRLASPKPLRASLPARSDHKVGYEVVPGGRGRKDGPGPE